MAIRINYEGMSDLEREIELEMDDEFDEVLGDEFGEGPDELGIDDDSEAYDELFDDSDVGEEIADDFEAQVEVDARIRDQEYVDRFLEIAGRQYESGAEVDQLLHETLDGLAEERLFGRFRRLAKKLRKNRVLRSLVKKGLRVASGQLPALRAAMSLAKGDLQGTIANLGRQALGTLVPGGGPALGALNALGFTQAENPEDNREAWENYVQLASEAYEHLADNVTATADQPLEASRLASNSYRYALKRAQARAAAQASARGATRGVLGRRPALQVATARHKAVRIDVKPGETYLLLNARKVLVRG